MAYLLLCSHGHYAVSRRCALSVHLDHTARTTHCRIVSTWRSVNARLSNCDSTASAIAECRGSSTACSTDARVHMSAPPPWQDGSPMNDSCDERGRLAARANPNQDSPDGRGTCKLRSCNDGLRMISVGAISDSSHVDSPRGPRTVVCLSPNIFCQS